ncbi:putative Transcription elongation factor SPT5 [Blattamonas nauphoetae]|uniref:Transcription elongation factor SPT5 n=1 Tax=Blattamonas nauphoetae TaxID=2049346 RepID=A0ABQ9XXJ3_9EUKA|nr:putative Transcription elongation factor SPT5 [Blattamonas nauphoetae]
MADQYDEEDYSEDYDDEEDDVRTKRPHPAAGLFDDAASEADEEDEEYEDADDLINGQTANQRELNQAEREAIRRREMNRRHKIDYEGMTEEALAERFARHENQEDMSAARGFGSTSRTAVLPTKDQKLWMVRTKRGCEREAVITLMNKFVQEKRKGLNPLMRSAAALDSIVGNIFIEAPTVNIVTSMIQGLELFFNTPPVLVPASEMANMIDSGGRNIISEEDRLLEELEIGNYVRVRRGLYKGDLAQVIGRDRTRQVVVVRLLPRLDYIHLQQRERDTQAKSARVEGAEDEPAQPKRAPPRQPRIRPPAAFFDPREALRMGLEVREDQQRPGNFHLGSMVFENGLLKKAFKENWLDVRNVIPTQAELEVFFRTTDEITDDFIAPPKRAVPADKLSKGEIIIVQAGDLRNIRGRVTQVMDEQVTMTPLDEGLTGDITLLFAQVVKYFAEGDPVVVASGVDEGKEGIVVRFDLDEGRVVIATRLGDAELELNANDLIAASLASTRPQKAGKFPLHSLVQLADGQLGCVFRVVGKQYHLLMLNGDGTVTVDESEIIAGRQGRFPTSRDTHDKTVAIGNTVRLVQPGPYQDLRCVVRQIGRNMLIVGHKDIAENGGLLAVTSDSIEKCSGEEQLNPNQNQRSLLDGRRSGKGRANTTHDLFGKTVQLCTTTYKGYQGVVKDVNGTKARVQLQAIPRLVEIETKNLKKIDIRPVEEASSGYNKMKMGDAARGPYTPGYTPLHSGATPMYGGSTPMYGAGGMTPAYGGYTPVYGMAGGSTPGYGAPGGMTPGTFQAGSSTPLWGPSGNTPHH